jgi:hypothetical protein
VSLLPMAPSSCGWLLVASATCGLQQMTISFSQLWWVHIRSHKSILMAEQFFHWGIAIGGVVSKYYQNHNNAPGSVLTVSPVLANGMGLPVAASSPQQLSNMLKVPFLLTRDLKMLTSSNRSNTAAALPIRSA